MNMYIYIYTYIYTKIRIYVHVHHLTEGQVKESVVTPGK